ncbi:uncharacterized protein [Antedon mediterranea]|uniref:uncharacterized protein n=1 Tax=Antedon mediterranea TaxID=105859 RepID=UPI003AF82AEC
MKLSLTIGLSLILSCTILDVVGAYGYNRLGQPEENLIREPGRVDYDLDTGNDEPWWKNDEEYLSADEMIGKLPDAMEEDPRSRTERVDDNIETPNEWYDINGDDQELSTYQDTADNLNWNDQSNDKDNWKDDNSIVVDEKETQFDIDTVNDENENDNLTNLDEDLTNLDEDEIDQSGEDYANLGGDEHINFDDDGNWDDQEKDQFEDNENINFDEDGDWDENDDEQEDQLTGSDDQRRYKRQVDSISDSRNEDFYFEEELPPSEGFDYSYIQ